MIDDAKDPEHLLPTGGANTTPKRKPSGVQRLLQCVLLAAALGLTYWGLSGRVPRLSTGTPCHHGISRIGAWLPFPGKAALPTEEKVNWDKAPIGELIEIQCWDENDYPDPAGLHCYRMAAPLDYTNASDHRRANLAVVKYEAGGGKTPRSQVLGSVFLNFGGPGGAGAGRIRRKNARTGKYEGERFSKVFEDRYDILSWDPRGVQKTWPRADCYGESELEYGLDLFESGADAAHASTGALPHQLASDACKNRTGDALRFVTTASTVKDLRLLYRSVGDSVLHYAGFSYGTAIGSVFADAYPDEVGRLWLDGVMDVPDYFYGNRMFGHYMETVDRVLSQFFKLCARAGGDHCALATLLTDSQRESSDGGASVLESMTLSVIESLREVPHAESKGDYPQLLTYRLLKSNIFSNLYAPTTWPNLTAALAQSIGQNDWSRFLASAGISKYTPPEKEAKRKYVSSNALTAISHADFADDSADEVWTVQRLKDRLAYHDKQSKFVGDVIIGNSGPWDIRAPDRWYGHFNATPAFPILFGSTQLDPSTPLEGAKKMSSRFPGSHLFRVADGIGHCTIAYPSKCASKIVADYFVRGKLPEPTKAHGDGDGGEFDPAGKPRPAPETVCYLDTLPFEPQPAEPTEEELALLGEEARIQVLREKAHADLAVHFADEPVENTVFRGKRGDSPEGF